jgi:hypothetical protein
VQVALPRWVITEEKSEKRRDGEEEWGTAGVTLLVVLRVEEELEKIDSESEIPTVAEENLT